MSEFLELWVKNERFRPETSFSIHFKFWHLQVIDLSQHILIRLQDRGAVLDYRRGLATELHDLLGLHLLSDPLAYF